MAKDKTACTKESRLEMSCYVTAERPLNSEKVGQKHLENCNNNQGQLPRYPCILEPPLNSASAYQHIWRLPEPFYNPVFFLLNALWSLSHWRYPATLEIFSP